MADSLDEFLKRYQHTFAYHRPTGNVVHIAGGVAGHLVIESETQGQMTLKYPESLVDVEFNPPSIGFFNHKEHALLLFKSPVRQWKRGLCSENHEVYNPFWAILRDIQTPYRPTWGWRLINSLFNRQLTGSVQQSIIAVADKLVSSAISLNLALSKSPVNSLNPLIWYRHSPVGFIENNKMVIRDETYHQEVIDELRRIGQSQWIS